MAGKKTRGAVSADVAARQKVAIYTSDGPVFVEVLELRQRGGKDRFGMRVEAPLTVGIVFPHAVGAMETGG